MRIYVIWLPMLGGDTRSEVDEGLLADPRVRQFWDGERVTGRWFAEANLGDLGYAGIVWDAYFLFGPDAFWDQRPSELIGSGATVIEKSGELRARIEPLLGAGA